MKKISSIWLMLALFVMPCILDLENMWCLAFIAVNIGASFFTFKKYNPEYLN